MNLRGEELIENRKLRDSVAEKIEVLNKVKALTFLPDDLHLTVEMSATYYEVGEEAISSVIKDNRIELEMDGLKVLTGSALKSFKDFCGMSSSKAKHLAIIPRRALLRIGMLLRDSEVAKSVRSYLLDIEQETRPAAVVQIPTELNLLGQISSAISQSFKAMVEIQNDLNETKKEVHETKEENKQLKQEIDDVKNGMVDINAPLRTQFNDSVRAYARSAGIDWNAAYRNVYDTLGKQYHINFKKRLENRLEKGEKVKLIDIVEELNLLVPAIRLAKTLMGVAS